MSKSDKIWLAISGIILVVLGILCLCKPIETLFATAWIIGCMTLVAGISKLIFTLRTQSFLPNSASRVISAILLIIVGIIFLCNNFFVASALPIVFVLWVLVESIILAIESFDYKRYGFSAWWVLFLLGIAGVVLGIFGLRNPDVSAKTLSVLIGISLIVLGIAYIVALCGVNRFEKQVKEFFSAPKEKPAPEK